MGFLRELADYLRLHVCLSSASISLFGYLCFNSFSLNGVLIFISTFLIIGAIYSFNFLTDRMEDSINLKRRNRFIGVNGLALSSLSAALGVLTSALLPWPTPVIAFSGLGAGISYSVLHLKRAYMTKNTYIAAGFVLIFLYGASAGAVPPLPSVLLNSIVFFITIFGMGLLADLRDYEGDLAVGIETIPVKHGYATAERVVYGSLCTSIILMFLTGSIPFYALSVFVLSALLLLFVRAPPALPHHYMRVGLVMLPLLQLLLSFLQ